MLTISRPIKWLLTATITLSGAGQYRYIIIPWCHPYFLYHYIITPITTISPPLHHNITPYHHNIKSRGFSLPVTSNLVSSNSIYFIDCITIEFLAESVAIQGADLSPLGAVVIVETRMETETGRQG